MNIIELVLYITLYYGFVYLSIPYALGQKFANLFGKKDVHKIRTFAAPSCILSDNHPFSTWQYFIRFLAIPGLFLGWLICKIVDFIAYQVCSNKTAKLILMSIVLPFVIALALSGIEQLYLLCSNCLLANWREVTDNIPSNTFFLFGFFASIANLSSMNVFNIWLEMLKLIVHIPLNVIYFATIFGIFEISTVSLARDTADNGSTTNEIAEDENMATEVETAPNEEIENNSSSNMHTYYTLIINSGKKIITSVCDFFKEARVPYTCRIQKDDDMRGVAIQDCRAKRMNIFVFICTLIVLFFIMFLWLVICGETGSFVSTLWEFVKASGLLQSILSFFITILASLVTHQSYMHLPEGIRDTIDEKLADAVSAVIERDILSVSNVLDTRPPFKGGGSSGSNNTTMKTNFFK